jgi:protein gp37
MAEHSNIAWTNSTWNPTRGCERVSPGCVNCYAEELAARHSYPGGWGEGLAKWVTRPDGKREARWTGVLRSMEGMLDAPIRWRSPRRIFVNSMSDLFHDDVPEGFIDRVFAVMTQATRHTYQVLTKRPERMLRYVRDWERRTCAKLTPNVWLGVSAEDQDTFDERVELLGQVPAAVRWVSAEPLLGWIDVGNAFDDAPDGSEYQPVNWVVVGGESGSDFRPMDMDAARWVIQQCQLSNVPVFVKQDNGPRPGMKGRFTDAEWALKAYPVSVATER